LQIYPNFIDALNKKALTLYRLQQYDKALEKLDEAISMDSNNSHAYNLKGLALMNCNRYSEALSAFDKSIEIDSKYLAPLKNKGIVSMKIQKYNEAIDNFNNALQIDPIDQFAMDAKNTAMHLLNLYSRLYVIDEASE
jgi:tetratricopeptide (TPR) repeat protein